MLSDLKAMKRNLKDFIFREGNRNMRLFDPNIDLRGLEEDDIWGTDPVHPRSEMYGKIAEGIVIQSGALENKQNATRKRADSLENSSQPGTSGNQHGNRGAASLSIQRKSKRPQRQRWRRQLGDARIWRQRKRRWLSSWTRLLLIINTRA
jgi:hypothetical protein